MAQKSVLHKISHLHVIRLITWTSPSPPLALADLEKKEVYVLFCLLALKVWLRGKAYKRHLYFPKDFRAIASVNQKDALFPNHIIQEQRLFKVI